MTTKKNIFIAGARGFVGKNLVEYLSRNYSDIYALFYPYHKELELLDPVAVREYIEKNKIDIIVHGANIGGSRKTAYDVNKTDVVAKNLHMFFNLARNLDKVEKMIHFGTGAEYSIPNYIPKMTEDYFDRYVPQDAYGFSKYVMTKYLEKSGKIINLRLFGVYGKYEDYEYKFISNAIVKNLYGMPITINQNVNFDYIYIDDLMRFVDYFINNEVKHKAYNAVRGETIDLLSIAKIVNSVAEKPSEIIVLNPGLNTEYSADNKRLMSEIKGFKYTSHEQAIRELYQWYKANMANIDRKAVEKDECIKHCRVKEVNK